MLLLLVLLASGFCNGGRSLHEWRNGNNSSLKPWLVVSGHRHHRHGHFWHLHNLHRHRLHHQKHSTPSLRPQLSYNLSSTAIQPRQPNGPKLVGTDAVTCSVCIMIVNTIKSGIQEGKEPATTVLSGLCDGLLLLSGVCKVMLHTFLPQILQMAEQGLDASAICKSVFTDCSLGH